MESKVQCESFKALSIRNFIFLDIFNKDVYTYTVMKKESLSPKKNRFALPCACANLRRAARLVTRLYDEELAGTGLELSQFTLLMALSRAGEIAQGRLGAVLSLDSTTLTRTLKPLIEEGLLQTRPGLDRRERLVGLTKAGKKKFISTLPNWESAQERLQQKLSLRKYDDLMRLLGELE